MNVVFFIGLLTCLAIATLVTGSYDNRARWVISVRVIIALASVIVLVRLVFFAHTKGPEPPPKPEPRPPTKRDIAQAYYNIRQNYKPNSINLFAKMLVDLPEYLERISEDAALLEESPQLRITTHHTYRVGSIKPDATNGDAQDAILIPVLFVQKGTLLDSFSVYDGTGCELPTLSYNQARGLLAHAIQAVINGLPGKAYIPGVAEDRRNAIRDLTEAICYPGPRKKQPQEVRARIDRLLDSVKVLQIEDSWKKRIRAFCETLADYYIIVAETKIDPGSNYVTLTYGQNIPLENSSVRATNRWRGRFGLSYSTIDIPLHLYAFRTEAYHLQMNAGPMEYVFSHHLEWLASGDALRPGELHWGDFVPYIRLHYSSATPVMHLYIRRQSSSTAATEALRAASAQKASGEPGFVDHLKSVVEFREIPPGALGAATIISFITMVIICFFAITQIGQEPSHVRALVPLGSDIPALLMTLPGVASLIIGSWLEVSRLRRASLTTYWGLGASLLLSVASALYFLWNAYRVLPGRRALGLPGGIELRTDIGWLILAGLSITCFLFLCRDVVTTSRYYFQRIKARVEARTDHG